MDMLGLLLMYLPRLDSLRKFSNLSYAGGIVLLAAVLVALIVANLPLGRAFESVLSGPVGFERYGIMLRYPLRLWINDGLMAIFFLLVGLEIKRELVSGELSSFKKASLPILCAVGGAAVPALIYLLINNTKPTAAGWGIPMATDIAFALAVITLLGSRVPPSLKIFLAALAIADDLMAILVIAFFYAAELHLMNLLYGIGVFALLLVFNKIGVRNLWFYLFPGLVMWYFIHHSGIHATIAGVLTALAIPVKSAQPTDTATPLRKLEHALLKPVNFVVVPLFALSNTNIHLESGMLTELWSPLGMGIIAGLVAGKPAGILLLAWLSTSTGLSQLPAKAGWRHILGVGLLGGIGFTMSIFISLLSFKDHSLISEAKFAILISSFMAAISGYLLLSSGHTKSNL
jgi:NhaA family Na+:H+ antiporter